MLKNAADLFYNKTWLRKHQRQPELKHQKPAFTKFLLLLELNIGAKPNGPVKAFERQDKHSTFGISLPCFSGVGVRGKPLLLQHPRRGTAKPVSSGRYALHAQRPCGVSDIDRHDVLC